jgi:hypothetical protein
MRKLFLAIALTVVGVGCGANDGGAPESRQSEQAVSATSPSAPSASASTDEKADFVIRHYCNEASCTAAGGYCNILSECEPGCENSPMTCTASVPYRINGAGPVDISCTGTGNGVYHVYFTTAQATETGIGEVYPGGPWTLWWDLEYTNSSGDFVMNGQPLTFTASENNVNFPGCLNSEGYIQNPADCVMVATFVEVCAEPGTSPFTEQSGVCGSSGETFNPTCVEVPVTYP